MTGLTLWVLIFAAAAAFAAVLTVLHYRYWSNRLRLPDEYEALETIETPDGGALELRRLSLPKQPELPPVLIVHGVAANYRNIDAEPERSLARILALEGRDVWLVTLRSGVAGFRGDASFASMVKHDLPAAFAAIRERTRADALDYVGFSMGGILLYAALGRTVQVDELDRAVFIGCPGRLPLWVSRWARLPLIPSLSRLFPLRIVARLFAFMVGWVHTPLHSMVIQKGNALPESARWAMANMVQSVPPVLLSDFLTWARAGGVIKVDGQPILDSLRQVTAPARFFAGSKDILAPTRAVEAAFDAWGAEVEVDKSMTVVGPDSGSGLEYGHGDLAIGRHVVDELFLPVARFLRREPSI